MFTALVWLKMVMDEIMCCGGGGGGNSSYSLKRRTLTPPVGV